MRSQDSVDPFSTFSTPFDAPLVPTFPFTFRDVLILTVVYRSDPTAIRRLVPPPLRVVDDLVAVQIYQMNDTEWFGAYNESAVQVPVEHPASGRRGAYSPYLLLDHDGGISAGREVYGQPKKYGDPRIEVRKDLVVGTVARNGIDVITATMPYKTRRSAPEAMRRVFDFETNINLKVIPSADGGDGIRELTARRLTDVQVHECWTGPATMELRPNAQVPVHLLAVREVVCGFLWHADFTLALADVLHDYHQDGVAMREVRPDARPAG